MELQVFFDYVCPYCYLGIHQLEAILQNYPEIILKPVPVEINPYGENGTACSLSDDDEDTQSDYSYADWYKDLKPHLDELGLPFDYPQTDSPSYVAIQGLLYLMAIGKDFFGYSRRVYNHVFKEGISLEDMDLIGDDVEASGGSSTDFKRAIIEGTYTQAMKANNALAWDSLDLEAVPTYRFNAMMQLTSTYGHAIALKQLEHFIANAADSR